ncbi:MAG: TonB-dependent receptor plug domain-containing protein [Candidatus Omnitrophica bacterium]|nr:TonB-dependent receptor plug domain-containing protein [Candidatus Omnitrophota bacterium]
MYGRISSLGVWVVVLTIGFLGVCSLPVLAVSEEKEKKDVKTLGEVTVTAVEEEGESPFLPDVDGTKIYAGKKTTLIDMKELPTVTNNNFRQALVKVPGLLLSEESTPLFSVGYRGLEPHRAQFIQVMKDGVPIHADMFGYPESYYVPPLQTVEKIEFIRGGAGLMYGPQPGGALNFVTHKPVLDKKFRIHSENVFGSDNYFSTYEALTGTIGPLGYLGYFHERQGDGFRDANSDFEVISSGTKAVINQTGDSRLIMNYDEYHEEHGEPGGLTRAQFDADPSVTTREFDRFRLERYYGSIKYEKEFSEDTQFDSLVYGGRYRRYSKRQRGGGFGTVPTGANVNSNDVEEQNFYNLGFEPRFRHNYELFGNEHTLTLGTHTFMSHSPRTDQRGRGPASDSGILHKEAVRDSWYLSVFLENLFRFGKLSVTPGARLEHFWQKINERRNVDKTTAPLADTKEFDFEPLFGSGTVYEIAKGIEAYANISQSYRPKIFTQAVPTGTNQVINEDLREGKGVQYDFGLRGKPLPFLAWDVDYFFMTFSNQIGTEGNTVTNAGRAHHQGMEFFTEVDLVGAYDYFNKTHHVDTLGSLSPFVTLTVLDAEFSAGPFEGRQPQYAPQYNFRFGTVYKWRDRVKISLLSTFVDEHFADDASTANRFIPSYKVWDLTAEVNLLKNVRNAFDVSIFGGINNLFDEHYYARVRSDGIDPANERNIYGGVKINLG